MSTTEPTTDQVLRAHAEQAYAHELTALAQADDRPRPPRWKLSPWAVSTYLLGGTLPDGTVITRSTSAADGSSRSRSRRSRRIARSSCSACRVRRSRG